MSKITTVLFDLDGTLIDTAPDMAAALDKLCEEEQHHKPSYESVRPRVSDGSAALVKLAFGEDTDADKLEQLKQRYLEIYQHNLATHSRLFEQMELVFKEFDRRNIKWGVVTNKPEWLTLPLMKTLQLDKAAVCIVSGDTTKNRKPHPEPIHHACAIAGSTPEQCMYVGDALRDIEAGNNAGMKTVIARYGYIDESINLDNWNADYFIDSPIEIIDHL